MAHCLSRGLLLSMKYWLVNRDPYNGFFNNQYIAGEYNPLYIYTLNNKQSCFIAPVCFFRWFLARFRLNHIRLGSCPPSGWSCWADFPGSLLMNPMDPSAKVTKPLLFERNNPANTKKIGTCHNQHHSRKRCSVHFLRIPGRNTLKDVSKNSKL